MTEAMTLRFQHKLSIPSAALPLIERPYLLERLEQAITSKQLVALAALAGWGKTTALAQWSACSALPVAWYSIDSTDRDPRQFLDYVLAAVQPYVPGAPELLTRLASCSPQGLPELFHDAALAVAAAGLPLMLSSHLVEVLTGMVLVGIGTFFAQACATGFVGLAAQDNRGVASGTYLACYFLGGLSGSIVLGQLFDRFGWSACVTGVGAALGIAALLATRLRLPPVAT